MVAILEAYSVFDLSVLFSLCNRRLFQVDDPIIGIGSIVCHYMLR